jgi:Spy/CpxP family protein refolding chaperone
MKTLAIAMGLLMASTVAIAERPDNTHGGKHEQRKAHIHKELKLSDEQVQQMREIRESGGTRQEIQSVLTPEQQEKMASIRANNEGRRTKRMARMQTHLELTDEQVEQMREVHEQGGNRKDIQAILTEEQKAKMAQHRETLSVGGIPTE